MDILLAHYESSRNAGATAMSKLGGGRIRALVKVGRYYMTNPV
jgi:hypothetical protein